MSQSLLDLSGYIKFFVGLFALVNPVGILPVFISMTSYQAAAGRDKTNLTANLSLVNKFNMLYGFILIFHVR